jgi:cyclophilin family peptidyl-prolyl cis-trans isomerase
MYYYIFKPKSLLINYFMKYLQIVSAVLFLSLFVFNADAQVKKAPVKKVLAPAKKAVAFKPPVIKKLPGIRVKLTTDSGIIVIRLYDSTPLHRDNFVKLVNEHFYDSLLFHRVIRDFMIQGGDPLSRTAQAGEMLGSGGGEMQRIPAEFRSTLFHKKGVLAAARDGNPEKASSACQFYIVQGKKYSDADLNMMENQMGTKFSTAKRNAYKMVGGTPFLDMNYTVFGEVEKGMEVIDKIAAVPTAPGDRPLGDVRMKMEVVK